MPREILLAPHHWPGEATKVTNTYAGRPNCVIIRYGLTTSRARKWILSKATAGKVTDKTTKNALLAGVGENRWSYTSVEELAAKLGELIGKNRAALIQADMAKFCHVSGEQKLDDETWERIRVESSVLHPPVTHVRWFGHGSKGKVSGVAGHFVDLREIGSVAAVTQTPLLSLYSCETGAAASVAEDKQTNTTRRDAPAFILTKAREAGATAPMVVNSSTPTNMWTDATAFLEFPHDRHTSLSEGGAIADQTEAACRQLLVARKKDLAIRRWAFVVARMRQAAPEPAVGAAVADEADG